MDTPFVRYRNRKTPVELPSAWELLTFARFDDHAPRGDVKAIVHRALASPVKSSPLGDRLSASDKIAIIVEDVTRASPKKWVLEALFEALGALSVPDENIMVVIALGTHRAIEPDEMKAVYGEAAVERFEFINHNCYAEDLVPIGKLRTGREVKINRRVHEATFRIGVGSVFPHPMNGFGGGGKILFPGVADFDSIREHHLQYSFRLGAELGNIDSNSFHEEICALARSAGLNFIINSVLDHNDGLYDVVCGDPIEAHRAGAQVCRDIISKTFEKKADVTIISSFPYTEGPQMMKPLAPASLITREGGCIILCADVKGSLQDQFLNGFASFHQRYPGDLYSGVMSNFENRRPIFEGCPIEFNMAGGQALLAQHEFNIILVSEDVPRAVAETIGFRFAEDIGKAVEMASGMVPPNAGVHVVPAGGVILPIL